MNASLRFRQAFANRLFQIAAVAALASPIAAGCGSKATGGPGTPGGAGGDGGGAGEGGEGGSGGAHGVSSSSGDLSTASGAPTTACFAWPTDQLCPSADVAEVELHLPCYDSVLGDGTRAPDETCCYEVISLGTCGTTGRPFLVNARPLTARALISYRDRGWARGATLPCPDVACLSPAERAELAAAWTRDALFEHASVASFARFSLDLMAVGAPADLIAAAHAAAIDEVNHAKLCFALASTYGDVPVEPRPFPFGGSVTVGGSLAALAHATVQEGCIGETLAALQALEQLERATDPAVRAVLTTIAEDEARHAELAFRAVAWALTAGGAEVRRAVVAAFAEAERSLPAAVAGEAWSEALLAHGRLDAQRTRAACQRALVEVVLPAAEALLGRPTPEAPTETETAPCRDAVLV